MLGNIPDRYAGVKFHGQDGMGDAPNPLSVDINMIQTEHAVQALVRLAGQYPGKNEIDYFTGIDISGSPVAHKSEPNAEMGHRVSDST